MNVSVTTEVHLLGQKLRLKTQGEPTRAERVAALVKERLDAAEERLKGHHPPHLIAIHALFEMADEYLDAQSKVANYQNELRAAITPTPAPSTGNA